MNELFKVILVTAVALGAAATGLMLGDSRTVVPPPESVAEQFTRYIAARRYEPALQYVDDRSGITLTTVRVAADALRERAGGIDQVEGEPGSIAGDRATAAAVLTTRHAGPIRYAFRLQRREGVWRISKWEAVP